MKQAVGLRAPVVEFGLEILQEVTAKRGDAFCLRQNAGHVLPANGQPELDEDVRSEERLERVINAPLAAVEQEPGGSQKSERLGQDLVRVGKKPHPIPAINQILPRSPAQPGLGMRPLVEAELEVRNAEAEIEETRAHVFAVGEKSCDRFSQALLQFSRIAW